MKSGGKAENRTQEIGLISRALKVLAKELDIPILAAAQLNRDLEKRGDKLPQLSDLRESGDLEQDADVVIFLYQPDPEQKNIRHSSDRSDRCQATQWTGRYDLHEFHKKHHAL